MGFSGFVASMSQIMLKKSALKHYSNWIREYLNFWVIGAYFLLAASMFLNIIAYRGISYQTGIVMGALPYIFIIILEKIFFHKKINCKKVVGTCLIILGIFIYAL